MIQETTMLKQSAKPQKRASINEIIAFTERAKSIPNPMPAEEREKLLELHHQALDSGDKERAAKYLRQIPLQWYLALTLMESYGKKAVKEQGYDLSYADAVMGERYMADD